MVDGERSIPDLSGEKSAEKSEFSMEDMMKSLLESVTEMRHDMKSMDRRMGQQEHRLEVLKLLVLKKRFLK